MFVFSVVPGSRSIPGNFVVPADSLPEPTRLRGNLGFHPVRRVQSFSSELRGGHIQKNNPRHNPVTYAPSGALPTTLVLTQIE